MAIIPSSTGISQFLSSNLKYAIFFDDPICPNCGENLSIDSRNLKSENIKIRYVCINCGFICPIKHDIENENINPLYDNTIKEFLSNFGEELHSRIKHQRCY